MWAGSWWGCSASACSIRRGPSVLLADLALRLATRAPAPLAAMGLVGEGIGLWSRGWRQRRAWAAHHAACKAVILRAMDGLPHRRGCVVLGSGPARDIPVEALAATFGTVTLVDAVHLAPVRWRLRRLKNVHFAVADLSGLGDWIAGTANDRGLPLAGLVGPQTDLVISCNLLSQLPIGIETALEAQPARAAALPVDLPRRAVEGHLADLAACPGRVCLITDTDWREEDRSGRVLERHPLLHGVDLPAGDDAWDWPVAPFGEVLRHVRYVHEVRAFAVWPKP